MGESHFILVLEAQVGKCVFQPVPGTVEERLVMVVEEKAPQPQSHQPRWAVEMGSLGCGE